MPVIHDFRSGKFEFRPGFSCEEFGDEPYFELYEHGKFVCNLSEADIEDLASGLDIAAETVAVNGEQK